MTASISYKLLNLRSLIVFIKHVFIFKLQQCIFIEVSLTKIIFLFPLHLFILNFNAYLAIHLFTLFYSSYALYFQSFLRNVLQNFIFDILLFYGFLLTDFFSFFFCYILFLFFFSRKWNKLNEFKCKTKFLEQGLLTKFYNIYFLCRHCISIYFRFKEIWVQKIKYLLNKNVNAA